MPLTKRDAEIGKDVSLDRIQSNLTVKACAKYLGISDAEYLASETGERPFSTDELHKLAELFQSRIDWKTTDSDR